MSLLKKIMEPMNIATRRTLDLKDPSSLEYDPLEEMLRAKSPDETSS